MHVVILGAGGLGCVIGACLAETGVDVSLIARPTHVERSAATACRSPGCAATAVVRTVRAVADARRGRGRDRLPDLARRRPATPTVALESAATLRERTAVALSLQNSVTKDDRLGRVDRRRSRARRDHRRSGDDGRPRAGAPHRDCADLVLLRRARRHASRRGRSELADAFTKAGMGAQATPDIRQAEWEKLLQISVVAGFSASTLGFRGGRTFAHGIAVRRGAEHYVTIATELLAVYQAHGLRAARLLRAVLAVPRAGRRDVRGGRRQRLRARHHDGRQRRHRAAVAARGHRARAGPPRSRTASAPISRRPTAIEIAAPTARGAYRVIKTLEALQ